MMPSFMVVNADEITEIDLAAPDRPSGWDQTWLPTLLAMLGGGLAALSLVPILFILYEVLSRPKSPTLHRHSPTEPNVGSLWPRDAPHVQYLAPRFAEKPHWKRVGT